MIYFFQTLHVVLWSLGFQPDTRSIVVKHILAVIVLSAFAIGHAYADGWMVDHEPVSPADFAREVEVKTNIDNQAQQCLNLFGPKKITELKKKFYGKMFVTFLDAKSGGSRMTSASARESEKASALANSGGLELVLYGRHLQKHPRIQGLFQYDEEWRAMFVPALEMNPVWFCGIFIHELFHASEDRMRLAEKKPQHAYLSPAWIDEELTAHELEREVVNAYTGGQYLSAMKAFVTSKGLSLASAQTAIRQDGVPALLSIASPKSGEEASLRRAQMLIDATLLYIEKEGGGIEKKRNEYAKLIQEHRRRH